MSTPPKWFAQAMATALLEDFIKTMPWYKRWTLHVMAFCKINYIPDWAIPPGWKRTK
jgi:hypothetical protein